MVLLLYPLVKVNQGIDVADTTYSLANFQYFGSMDGTWMVATFLSNAAGSLMMHLPFGDTLMGMYCYTGLVQSALALMVYGVLSGAFRKNGTVRMPAALVFAGEMTALGLCWCPSTILYNYLTYLLMTGGILLLYQGIVKEDWKYDLAAGICLGANVAVRMPNVVQTAFIVAVWYGAVVYRRTFRQVLRETGWCMSGYAAGVGIPYAAICIRYGMNAYPDMVKTMFAMTEKATDYKPASMVTGMFGDYAVGLYWLIFAGVCMLGGGALLIAQRKFFADKKGADRLCMGVYGAVLLVLLRFYWGRGVFSFRYYEYGSMYYPAVLFLIVSIGVLVNCLMERRAGGGDETAVRERKILALLVLVQIFVTPLGSNNALYPIINNLFVTAPFVLWAAYEKMKDGARAQKISVRIWGLPFALLTVFVLVQSAGFHMRFTFQDGIDGVKRDAKLMAPAKAAGIYTNQDNAGWLSELAEYMEDAGLTGREVLLYGEIPGLGYLLDMPSALSTFWADLDSYRMVEYERDLAGMTASPVIIVASPVAAYLNEDAKGMNWFGVDRQKLAADEKLQILGEYMKEHAYQETFSNGRYVVYVTE